MDTNVEKQVIDLNPYEVTDETLAALEAEIRDQASDELNDVSLVQTIVIDGSKDGLNSHATIFTEINTNNERD